MPVSRPIRALALVAIGLPFLALAALSAPFPEGDRGPEVIYGSDDRRDYYEVTDPPLRWLFESEVALFDDRNGYLIPFLQVLPHSKIWV